MRVVVVAATERAAGAACVRDGVTVGRLELVRLEHHHASHLNPSDSMVRVQPSQGSLKRELPSSRPHLATRSHELDRLLAGPCTARNAYHKWLVVDGV